MIGTKKVKKNGKTYTYPRNYVTEYQARTPKQKQNRVVRKQARAKMVAKHGASALRGKDVDHKRGIGGGNGFGNLRILSKHKNRAKKWK